MIFLILFSGSLLSSHPPLFFIFQNINYNLNMEGIEAIGEVTLPKPSGDSIIEETKEECVQQYIDDTSPNDVQGAQ
jgi:hypothetical protein